MPKPQTPVSCGSNLPDRVNLEHLRKLAKVRLAELRHSRPDAQLAEAQLEIARRHGFPSWRALKAAFDHRVAEGDLALGDWIGHPEGGVPLALHVRREAGRLRAQLDVPALGYMGDPVEAFSVTENRMAFRVTVRGVNAIYQGEWNDEAAEWQGLFTHGGRAQPLSLHRGVFRAPRAEGLDGLWDAQSEDGTWLTFRIVTDDRGTFAWLSSSAVPGRWFQAAAIQHLDEIVRIEMKTLRVEGELEASGDCINGRVHRQDRDSAVSFRRRTPGGPTPWSAG